MIRHFYKTGYPNDQQIEKVSISLIIRECQLKYVSIKTVKIKKTNDIKCLQEYITAGASLDNSPNSILITYVPTMCQILFYTPKTNNDHKTLYFELMASWRRQILIKDCTDKYKSETVVSSSYYKRHNREINLTMEIWKVPIGN